MNQAPRGRFDALRDSIVAHLEQVELRLRADIQGQGERLDSLARQVGSLAGGLEALRVEMVERFESVDQRFRTLELRMTLHENKVIERLELVAAEIELLKGHVASLDANFARLHTRLDPLEAAVSSWAATTAALADDMRQRFRAVNDRLAGIEQRLAA